MMNLPSASVAPLLRTWYVLFRICVVLSAVLYTGLLSGFSGLLEQGNYPWTNPIHRVHNLGAISFISIIVTGLLAQLRAPSRSVAAFWQVVAALLAIQITNLILGNPDNHGGNVGIMDPAFLVFVVPLPILTVLHPSGRGLYQIRVRRDGPLFGIVLAATIPFAISGVQQALLQRHSWPPLADPHRQKWLMMAFLAFTIPLVGLTATFKTQGWLISVWSAGLAAILFGLAAVWYPEVPSSVGRLRGSASVLGGVAFILVAMWQFWAERAGRPS